MNLYPISAVPSAQSWFMERNPISATSGIKGIVALDDNSKIHGMIVMDTWTENSCQVHIAIDTPMVFRCGLLEESFDYIFDFCGRGIVYGITPANDKRALKFNQHAGFVEVARLKDAHEEGVDLIIQEVRKENYYGQRRSRAA